MSQRTDTSPPERPVRARRGANKMEKITKEMHIGDVMRRHPETRRVFIQHFGVGCFTCPGVDKEDIYFGSAIHNVDMDVLLKELNLAVTKAKDKGKKQDG